MYQSYRVAKVLLSNLYTVILPITIVTWIQFLIFQIDQQGSLWTFQARRMNGDMGSFQVLPDQMQLANPFM